MQQERDRTIAFHRQESLRKWEELKHNSKAAEKAWELKSPPPIGGEEPLQGEQEEGEGEAKDGEV